MKKATRVWWTLQAKLNGRWETVFESRDKRETIEERDATMVGREAGWPKVRVVARKTLALEGRAVIGA